MKSFRALRVGSALRAALLMAVLTMLSACKGLPVADVPLAPQPGAPAVVFDIDGTLTPSIAAINSVRPDAAAVASAYAASGYTVIYLSARTRMLQTGIPGWLHRNGFPDGSVHVAQTNTDHDHPAAFKQRILEAYVTQGWRLVAAFGDSSTDFEAYAEAGIPQEGVFALRRRGRRTCEPGQWQRCLPGWSDHLPLIEGASP